MPKTFEVENFKVFNIQIKYYEKALLEILSYLPLIFEKGSINETIYLNLKESYKNTIAQESVFVEKTVEIYESCFIVSFVLTKTKIEISGVSVKKGNLRVRKETGSSTVSLLVKTTLLILSIVIVGMGLYLGRKNKQKRKIFVKVKN